MNEKSQEKVPTIFPCEKWVREMKERDEREKLENVARLRREMRNDELRKIGAYTLVWGCVLALMVAATIHWC